MNNESTKIENLPEDAKRFFTQHGKIGGERTKKKYGPNYYKRIGKMAAKKRWKGHKRTKVDKSSLT